MGGPRRSRGRTEGRRGSHHRPSREERRDPDSHEQIGERGSSSDPARRPWTAKAEQRRRDAAILGVVVVIAVFGFGLYRWHLRNQRREELHSTLEEMQQSFDRRFADLHVGREQLRALPQGPATIGTEPTGARATEANALRAALRVHHVESGPLRLVLEEEGGAIYGFAVRGREALAFRDRLRPDMHALGCYPLVVAWDEGRVLELAGNGPSVADTLQRAESLDAVAWLAKRQKEDPAYYGAVEQGEWGGAEPQSGFGVPFDYSTNEHRTDVYLFLIPTTRPWEVCAWMHFGGWNACPPPEVHVSLQRLWHDKHGAEIVCMSGDMVEFLVSSPPVTREAAMDLARIQFPYSGGDLVYQGFGTLRALAQSLVGARTWAVWWD